MRMIHDASDTLLTLTRPGSPALPSVAPTKKRSICREYATDCNRQKPARTDLQTQGLDVAVVFDDLPSDSLESIKVARTVAWDIETSGLDWRRDQIGTCQVYIPDQCVTVVNGLVWYGHCVSLYLCIWPRDRVSHQAFGQTRYPTREAAFQ